MSRRTDTREGALTRRRLAAQLLSGTPATSPEQVVDRLLAVQAQDPRGARLAVRSRSTGLSAADVDAALTDRRSLLISTLNRGTLHLVLAEDYWWLHPLTTPQLVTGNRTRLRQEGVSPQQAERGVAVVAGAVDRDGPQTRRQLKVLLDSADVPTAGQALVHVIFAAILRGLVVRGPMRGNEHAFVRPDDWLGRPPRPLERPVALQRLTERYLAGHGPADVRDLAKWAGITLGDARTGFAGAAAASRLVERPDGLAELAQPAGRADPSHPAASPDPPPDPPVARLLGTFDPLLHGWADRSPVVGDHRGVVTVNGIFKASALVKGRVVGTWGLADGTLSVTPLEKVPPAAVAALRRDAHDVLRFLGRPDSEPVVKAFPAP